jgi:hypothetical protein
MNPTKNREWTQVPRKDLFVCLMVLNATFNNISDWICFTCHKHFLSFRHSWLITWFVSRVTWQVPLVEQELLTLLGERPSWLWLYGEQTTQWPKEKVQKDKQWSTKHTHKTKDRVTRTPLKNRGEFRCYRRVSPTSGTHHVTLDKKKSNDKSWMKIGRDL